MQQESPEEINNWYRNEIMSTREGIDAAFERYFEDRKLTREVFDKITHALYKRLYRLQELQTQFLIETQ